MKKPREEHDERTIVERHDPMLGQTLGARFRIVEKIAAGGFGAIYRAHDLPKRRDVAVKVLHASLAADPNVIARFRREGATLSQLRAPHTVSTYELGETADGTLYIVMELLRGESLHTRLQKRRTLAWRDAVAITRAVCDALAEAHDLGIIHRDLKPANIHLEPSGHGKGPAEPAGHGRARGDFVKVLDFGIAKIRRGTGLDDGGDLTNAGQMIGTIDYMAPEQILGAACDGRTDIFTLGIVTYEMIAGRRPYADSTTPTSMLAALLTQVPPPLSQFAPVPPALDEAVARCLRREADERFATVQDLAAALDALLRAPPPGEDTATRQIDLDATRVADPISFDDEATTFAPEPRRRAPNTFESAVPPAPRSSHVVIPDAPPREPTPPPQRPRPPTPPPRTRAPTPPPRTPTPPPGALPAADASGWQRTPRATEPPAWHPPALPPVAHVPTPAGVPPLGHVPTPPGLAPSPPTPRSYDPSRDAIVGRVVWILALVVVVILGIGIYTAIR